jgi:hypothetical protein
MSGIGWLAAVLFNPHDRWVSPFAFRLADIPKTFECKDQKETAAPDAQAKLAAIAIS